MAVTITRSIWEDDDGTGTTGTVINQALHTTLYNEIDTALAKVAQLAGGNTFTGNQAVAGLLTVTGFGTHAFTAGGGGDQTLQVRNTQGLSTARGVVLVGNDNLAYLTALVANSSNFTPATFPGALANGSELQAYGAGGLTLVTLGAAPIRFFTNTAEYVRLHASGGYSYNTTVDPGPAIMMLNSQLMVGGTAVLPAQMAIAINATTRDPFMIRNLNAGNVGNFIVFQNSASGVAGYINQASATTVAYNTASDARLKTDRGPAMDLAALRAVVVHDFTWKADGLRDRGIFAQDAHAHYPRAVTPGDDDVTEAGALAHPWMTDYSKFVPDLIVGWQQHDADLAELRAILAAVKG